MAPNLLLDGMPRWERSSLVERPREEADRALFDRIAARYARKDHFRSSSIARKGILLQALEPFWKERRDLGRLVEIGCGVGATARYLDGLFDDYCGIDQSGELVRLAREIFRGHPHIRFRNENIKSVDWVGDKADTILLNGALHHMTELDRVLPVIRTIGHPGSMIVVIEPHCGNPIIQGLRKLRTRLDHNYSHEQVFFHPGEVESLLGGAGFKLISSFNLGFFSQPFAQVILHPQWLFTPISKLAVKIDSLLIRRLPRSLSHTSFLVAVIAEIPPSPVI